MYKQLFLELNIQRFGKDLKSANGASYGKRMSETEAHVYYDMTLKDAIYENYNMEKYFDTITLPKNHGKKMRFRKSGKYIANGEPLLEGVVPDEDKPMETYEYEVGLQSFGGYITYTDELDIFSIDKGETTRLQRNQGYAVGDLFQEKARNILLSTRNVWFASPIGGSATVNSTLQAAYDSCGRFNLDDMRKIKVFLNRTKVKPYDGGDYVMLISPEVESDIMTLAKSDDQFTFIEISNYQQNTKPLMEGEIGRWNNFRFVRENAIKEVAKTTSGASIHGCIILGKYQNEKGAKIVKLAGDGNIRSILKPLESGGARENPLNQIGSIGWKRHGWGGTVLYSEAVMVYHCLADEVAEEFDNTARDSFIGGYDNEGERIEPTPENIHINGGQITGAILTIAQAHDSKVVGNVARFAVSGSAENVLKAWKEDPQNINDYADAYSDGEIVFYTNVACTSAFTETAEVTTDTTIYIKKNVTE